MRAPGTGSQHWDVTVWGKRLTPAGEKGSSWADVGYTNDCLTKCLSQQLWVPERAVPRERPGRCTLVADGQFPASQPCSQDKAAAGIRSWDGLRVLLWGAAGWPIARRAWGCGKLPAVRGAGLWLPCTTLPACPRSMGQGCLPDAWDSLWTRCPSSQSTAGACPNVTIGVPPPWPGTTTPDTARGCPRSP